MSKTLVVGCWTQNRFFNLVWCLLVFPKGSAISRSMVLKSAMQLTVYRLMLLLSARWCQSYIFLALMQLNTSL